MYHLFMHRREDFMDHYHKRSNAETAYSMIKAKFGDSLRSKSDVGQLNEALCKVLCHNLCVLCHTMHELALESTLCTNLSRPAATQISQERRRSVWPNPGSTIG
jgi:hypothetical protein